MLEGQNLASIRAFFGVLKHGFSFHDDRLCKVTAFSRGLIRSPYLASRSSLENIGVVSKENSSPGESIIASLGALESFGPHS